MGSLVPVEVSDRRTRNLMGTSEKGQVSHPHIIDSLEHLCPEQSRLETAQHKLSLENQQSMGAPAPVHTNQSWGLHGPNGLEHNLAPSIGC
jgi:hypothetical protein